MSKTSRSTIVGFHNLKNKVSRNAFDLSHRHMFTAQIGELLPVFVQWVNPNETFKLGYNGFTRTQPLQTAAFTRLRENIQYYFVPFQSLWKYFEQQITNMTSGQSGENISRIASSPFEDSKVTTELPYINYNTLAAGLYTLLDGITDALVDKWNHGFHTYEQLKEQIPDAFDHEVLAYASTSKLLRALGYMNTDMDNYDIFSSFISYASSETGSANKSNFKNSKYGWHDGLNYINFENAPNLSILPLLAYNKIINDHYIYRQWQPYKSYTCNIDYLVPGKGSMNFATQLGNNPLASEMFRMKYSNLPLDYFNGVLPKAQYGEESAVSVVNDSALTGKTIISDPNWKIGKGTPVTNVNGAVVGSGSVQSTSSSLTINNAAVQVRPPHGHTATTTIDGSFSADLKISALRSAIALQKYKEIQESNDSDFASQVLAHFGVKPKHDDYKSYFIGGGDSTLNINPQINQNLADGNDPEIKATATGQLSAHCKFSSDTYGIIIGIYRCVPQLDLAHVGIDRNLFKTDASDFPIPELDRIGMQTQYRAEVCAPLCLSKTPNLTSASTYGKVDLSKTYGYLPRYAELKTSYDRFEGAFLDSLSSWVTGYNVDELRKWAFRFSGSQGSDPTYDDISELLECSPKLTYPIFLDQTSACCNNDKLLIGSVNTCVAVRPFSVYGLPYSK